jgi:hypothetical protein
MSPLHNGFCIHGKLGEVMKPDSPQNPDVIHIVEPIWLGAQVLIAMQLGWCGKEWTADNHPGLGRGVGGPVVASYHTNLPT